MFDPKKPVQTRDGRKARILCADRVARLCPIIALSVDSQGFEISGSFFADGRLCADKDYPSDLINIPVKHTVTKWFNFDADGTIWERDNKDEADMTAELDRIACKEITIEFTEGEGL